MSTENANDTTRFTLVFEVEKFVSESGDIIGGGSSELGLVEILNQSRYKVFVRGEELQIEATGNARIETVQIIDIQGREITRKKGGNQAKITLSNLRLSSGLYLVRVRDKKYEETIKVIMP